MASVEQTTTENSPPPVTYNANKTGLSLKTSYQTDFDQELRRQNPTANRLASASLPSSSVAASSAENSLNSSTPSQLSSPVNPHQELAFAGLAGPAAKTATEVIIKVLTAYGGAKSVKEWYSMPQEKRNAAIQSVMTAANNGYDAAWAQAYNFFFKDTSTSPQTAPTASIGTKSQPNPNKKKEPQGPQFNDHDGTEKCELIVLAGAAHNGLGVETWYKAQTIATPSLKSGFPTSTEVKSNPNDFRGIRNVGGNLATIDQPTYLKPSFPIITITGHCTFANGYRKDSTLSNFGMYNEMQIESVLGGAKIFYVPRPK
jgi:hypothetical protein